MEGERSAARRDVCFLGDRGACLLGDAMARGRVVELESESGSSIRCRLLGFARASGVFAVEPFFSHGRVLTIVTI